MAHDIIFGDDDAIRAALATPAIEHTEQHPTMNLRYLKIYNMDMLFTLKLQEEWAVITFDGMNRPIDRKTEWRDVPVVTE